MPRKGVTHLLAITKKKLTKKGGNDSHFCNLFPMTAATGWDWKTCTINFSVQSSPSRHRERSASRSPYKRRKTPDPPPSTGGSTLASILATLQQIQTDMENTNDRVSSIESHFEQPLGNFPPSHPSDDQISVRAYSDAELHYSEDCVSLATEPQSQAIKPQHQSG